MELKQLLEEKLKAIIYDLAEKDYDPQLSIPQDLEKGDFTTNISMRLAKDLGSPMETGEKIVEDIRRDEDLFKRFKRIELAKPGFINFYLSDAEIESKLNSLMYYDGVRKSNSAEASGNKMIFEFGDPNPFKEPHIGHLRNFILGDSLIKLLESQGAEVIRASYQGDVGLHVAKTLYGIMKHEPLHSGGQAGIKKLDEGMLEEKVKYLGACYQEGSRAYEGDLRKEIDDLNAKIYKVVENEENDTDIYSMWQKGRQISLDHFEQIYKTLGIKYDNYYFEKDVSSAGRKIVEENTPDIFVEDDGAVIYKGESDGLHTRVFLNSEKNPTYEAKDLALAKLKDKDHPEVKKSIIMTANEQIDYFKVVLKALEKIDKKLADKTEHISFGFVNLKKGKMSSRKGKVIAANWLIDEVKESIKKSYKEVPGDVLDEISLGAIKWSMLKFSRESDIAFSIDESIDLTGNSGPYMQYTVARISSILAKSSIEDFEANSVKTMPSEMLALGRQICQFEMHVKQASSMMQPNLLAEYLFDLAKSLNSIYEKERVLGHENEEEILMVLYVARGIIQRGLSLLGISAPEKI